MPIEFQLFTGGFQTSWCKMMLVILEGSFACPYHILVILYGKCKVNIPYMDAMGEKK